jgi:UDP-2,3-diacylglucosamine pyrophosphatase LpxH
LCQNEAKEAVMQVFISDIHLTDGTSGETISPKAFELLWNNLGKLLNDVGNTTELKVVLLGDIFDVIRSTKWLKAPVRPWSATDPVQEGMVGKIVNDIITVNQPSIDWLKKLSQLSSNFDMQYIIGNHDWLINRYPNIITTVGSALNISPPAGGFPTDIFEPAYKTFARHGDIYDELNYMGDRNKSSIGDAIVIELLNKFPEVVNNELNKLAANGVITSTQQNAIVAQLKEIDNIRPLLDAPSWVLMVSNMYIDPVRQVITDAWQKCVDDFFKIQFIKDMDIPFWPDTIDMLQIALQLSSHTSKWLLEKVVDLKNRFFPTGMEGDYYKKAWAEPKVRSGAAEYVLYGHTHEHLIVPMDQIRLNNGTTEDRIYFNTGTWRQTWNKAVFDTVNRKFIGWKVLTYIAFYNKDENKDYGFEVWNGALG